MTQLFQNRWYVLALVCSCSACQCLLWFTFSSVTPAQARGYFGPDMTAETINLLLNWGPLAFVLCPWGIHIMNNTRCGLQR